MNFFHSLSVSVALVIGTIASWFGIETQRPARVLPTEAIVVASSTIGISMEESGERSKTEDSWTKKGTAVSTKTTASTKTPVITTNETSIAPVKTAPAIPASLVISSIDPYNIPVSVPFTMIVRGVAFQNNADVELNGFSLGHFTLATDGSISKAVTITSEQVFSASGQNTIKVVNPDGTSVAKEVLLFHYDGVAKAKLDADKTPPTASMKSIISGWRRNDSFTTADDYALYGTVGISQTQAASERETELTTLEFFVDGTSIGRSVTAIERNTAILFDTTKFSDGTHTLTAIAYDAAGNEGSDSASFVIKNSRAQIDFTAGVAPSSTITIQPENDYRIWQSNANVTASTVELRSVSFRNTGSLRRDWVSNIRLYVDGAQIATVSSLNTDNYAIFNLSSNPVRLEPGSREIKVLVDVTADKFHNGTVQFSIRRATDIEFFDPQLGRMVSPTVNGQTSFTRSAASINVEPAETL
ncbi:MAG: hypothetical protein AAB517_02240 [Patescibacteria group bacterium]